MLPITTTDDTVPDIVPLALNYWTSGERATTGEELIHATTTLQALP